MNSETNQINFASLVRTTCVQVWFGLVVSKYGTDYLCASMERMTCVQVWNGLLVCKYGTDYLCKWYGLLVHVRYGLVKVCMQRNTYY